MSACDDPSTLYCSPTENEILSESQSYSLVYNPAFGSIQSIASVDVWLYYTNGTLFSSSLGLANNGAMPFTIDDSWYDQPAATTTQQYGYQWYVVAKGRNFNLPPAGQSFGPTFFALQSTEGSPSPTPVSSGSSTDSASTITPAPSTSLEPGATASSPGTTITPSASTSAASANSSGGGLPIGAIAGISIGAVLVFAALLMVMIFFRRRVPQDTVKLESDPTSPPPDDSEKSGFEVFERKTDSSNTHFDVPLAFAPGPPPGTPDTMKEIPGSVAGSTRDLVGAPRPNTNRPSAESERIPRSPAQQSFASTDPRGPPSPSLSGPPRPESPYSWQSSTGQRPPIHSQAPRGPPTQPPPVDGQYRNVRNQLYQPPSSRVQQYQPQSGRNSPVQPYVSRDRQNQYPQQVRNQRNQPPQSLRPASPLARNPPQSINLQSVQAQPVTTFTRQNSRRGLVPPFPLDVVTRKPIANRSPTSDTTPLRSQESEPDLPSDSDETPPPTKVSPVTPTTVPAIQVTEVKRPLSITSMAGKIEKRYSTPPLTPKVAVPTQTPMGTGFVGGDGPSTPTQPTSAAAAAAATPPPAPTPRKPVPTQKPNPPKAAVPAVVASATPNQTVDQQRPKIPTVSVTPPAATPPRNVVAPPSSSSSQAAKTQPAAIPKKPVESQPSKSADVAVKPQAATAPQPTTTTSAPPAAPTPKVTSAPKSVETPRAVVTKAAGSTQVSPASGQAATAQPQAPVAAAPKASSPPKTTAAPQPAQSAASSQPQPTTKPAPSPTAPTPQVTKAPAAAKSEEKEETSSTMASVTAEILGFSTTESDATSVRTSMVVEAPTPVQSSVEESSSRVVSFEIEPTQPLMISKIDLDSDNEGESKKSNAKKPTPPEKEETDKMDSSNPPTLPALEQGRPLSFGI